jgi:glycine cleavage system transcriptional repressor
MTHFAVSAIGSDQPGIVAGVTGGLVDLGCNLEDTTMSILRGHFAMMLVIAAPDGVTADDLEAALGGVAHALDLVVVVRAIDDNVPASAAGDTWTVSVYGADRPGIVHRVAKLLADEGININDLSTRVIGSEDRPVYAMVLDVTVPSGSVGEDVSARLAEVAAELGVECAAHPSDADIL